MLKSTPSQKEYIHPLRGSQIEYHHCHAKGHIASRKTLHTNT